MKNSIKTLLDAVAHDSRESIKASGGNVAEYIIVTAEAVDQGWFEFLSDEEIDEYESADADRREEIRDEIRAFVNDNYNYNILADELLEKWIVVDFGPDAEDRLRVTRRENFQEMDYCGAYADYGRSVGCESAGCYTFSNSESSVFLDFSKALYQDFEGIEDIVDENEMTDRDLCEFFIDPVNHNPGRELFGIDRFNEMLSYFKKWETENTSHTQVTGWTFHDSHNFETVILETPFGETDCEELDEDEQKEILLQMPQTAPHMAGFNTSEETEDYIFSFDRWATNPWFCFVERK
jgi:hypothetical protein